MKKIILVLSILFSMSSVYAGPTSLLGGKSMDQGTAHYVGFGWPSVKYEWWHSGSPDWALGAELIYGDWSGEFSNVDIGFGFNAPFRWLIHQSGNADFGFKIAPGALIGSINAPGNDLFVFGIRADVGVPITIDINDKFNLITGASVPFSVMFVESANDYVIIPLMGRIGMEFKASDSITPSLVLELGPTIAVGGGNTDVELGLRAWFGSAFF